MNLINVLISVVAIMNAANADVYYPCYKSYQLTKGGPMKSGLYSEVKCSGRKSLKRVPEGQKSVPPYCVIGKELYTVVCN